MKVELPLRVILVGAPMDLVYGIQRGRGSSYEVAFAQRPTGTEDVVFEFAIVAAEGKDGAQNLLGEFVQGPTGRRFIYVDVGRYAKQADTHWARRMLRSTARGVPADHRPGV